LSRKQTKRRVKKSVVSRTFCFSVPQCPCTELIYVQALQWFGAKPNLGMDFTRAEEKEHLERGAVGCKTRQHYKLKK
jgi:hypothetical protein